jgi:hypothetical protein
MTGWQAAQVAGGVSAAAVRKRQSMVSELFAFLLARGDKAANLAPRRRPAPLEAVPSWSECPDCRLSCTVPG